MNKNEDNFWHVSYVYEHSITKIWAALTTPELVELWSMKPDENYAPIKGRKFQLLWKPSKISRGYFDCEVLDIIPMQMLRYSWDGDGKSIPLIVNFTLSPLGRETGITMTIGGKANFGARTFVKMIFGPGMKREITAALPKVLEDMDEQGNFKPDSQLKPIPIT